jgi:16S rRNA U516 pseudouridylate synthase RsuA-like enzyme
MCETIGHPVTHLKRVAIGPIRDARLKLGKWRDLTLDEVKKLRAAASASFPRSSRSSSPKP